MTRRVSDVRELAMQKWDKLRPAPPIISAHGDDISIFVREQFIAGFEAGYTEQAQRIARLQAEVLGCWKAMSIHHSTVLQPGDLDAVKEPR